MTDPNLAKLQDYLDNKLCDTVTHARILVEGRGEIEGLVHSSEANTKFEKNSRIMFYVLKPQSDEFNQIENAHLVLADGTDARYSIETGEFCIAAPLDRLSFHYHLDLKIPS